MRPRARALLSADSNKKALFLRRMTNFLPPRLPPSTHGAVRVYHDIAEQLQAWRTGTLDEAADVARWQERERRHARALRRLPPLGYTWRSLSDVARSDPVVAFARPADTQRQLHALSQQAELFS